MRDQLSLNRLVQVLSWIILIIAGVLSVAPLIPPNPPSDSEIAAFSVTRAFESIESISQKPRPIGSAENQRVSAFLAAQLDILGLEPEIQIIDVPNYFGSVPDIVEIGNVVARIPGTSPTTAVALVGHYDTVPSTPGANDNASAVAIILETARAILAGNRLRNDVILVFTDGEEPAPRFGSSAFVAEHPWASDIGFVVNLEAVGESGQSIISQISGPEAWVIDRYVEAVPYPAAYSFLTTMTKIIGGPTTDFVTFSNEGIAGVEFVYLTGSPIYHTLADIPERVSWRSLYQQGANTLALARHIGSLDFESVRDDSEAVFFNVGRRHVIRYPSAWSLPVVVMTGVLLLAASRRLKQWQGILWSAFTTVVTMVSTALASVGIWTVLARQRNAMGVAESYLYLFGLLALVAVSGVAIGRLTRRHIGEDHAIIGVITVWWALGLLTAIAAPGMSYLFVLPVLGGALTLLWRGSTDGDNQWLPLFTRLVIGTALVVLVPTVDIFYQFAQPRPGNPDSELLFLIAVPVALLALMVELFRALWIRPRKGTAPEPKSAVAHLSFAGRQGLD